MTIPSGKALTVVGTQTSTGLITANGGITVASGQTLLVSGTQTSTGLISANGGITVASGKVLTVSGTQTSTGLITANGGITVASGQTLASNKLDALTADGAQTVGGNITTGSISIGGALTTGDINIGTISTSDIYIGNGTNATTGTDKGTCHINKCQILSGSIFRSVLFGTVSGGSGSNTVPFGQTLPSIPSVVGTMISTTRLLNHLIGLLIVHKKI